MLCVFYGVFIFCDIIYVCVEVLGRQRLMTGIAANHKKMTNDTHGVFFPVVWQVGDMVKVTKHSSMGCAVVSFQDIHLRQARPTADRAD